MLVLVIALRLAFPRRCPLLKSKKVFSTFQGAGFKIASNFFLLSVKPDMPQAQRSVTRPALTCQQGQR